MSEFQFTIPGRMPGLNEVIGAARSHWALSSKQKKVSTETCRDAAVAASLKPITRPVTVRIVWYEKDQRRDVDNIAAGAKFLLDGLVLAGVLVDDDQKHVTGITSVVAVDKVHPRIVVTITEQEPI